MNYSNWKGSVLVQHMLRSRMRETHVLCKAGLCKNQTNREEKKDEASDDFVYGRDFVVGTSPYGPGGELPCDKETFNNWFPKRLQDCEFSCSLWNTHNVQLLPKTQYGKRITRNLIIIFWLGPTWEKGYGQS